jgi:hypothetical protein
VRTVLTWLIVTACLAFVVKDYLPKKKTPDIAAAEAAIEAAARREALSRNELAELERELEHSRDRLVETNAPLRRDSLAYVFGKRNVDTTDVQSLNAQLKRADTVIVDQQKKITALEADTAVKARTILVQKRLLWEKDDKYAALERLNKGIKAQIPTRMQQLKHDATVATVTAGVLGALQLVFGQ